MKKVSQILAIAMLAFIGAATVQAQGIEIGAKAGLNFATIGGDDVDSPETLTSFHVGFYADLGITEKFSVQPELVYSRQGASFETDIPNFVDPTADPITVSTDLELDYCSTPNWSDSFL